MNLRSGSTVGQGILTSERRPLFEEGCQLVFRRWTALQLAVEHGWGGPQSQEKALDVIDDVADWFYRRKEHYEDELEDELLAAMSEDFNCDCEDGSPKEVARVLVQLYKELCTGDTSGLERLRASGPSNAQASQMEQVDRDGTLLEGDDSDSDMEDCHGAVPGGDAEMGEASAPAGPIVDDDGFTLVQGRRGRR
mmetsp:Transcript_5252/g.12792  ORF Transcript_5252/g.12792 Transcript_5252/m.12792 type:complete len:194 (+) Transcript_5252:342-923(+)